MRVIISLTLLLTVLWADVKAQLQNVNAISQKHPDSALIILKKIHATAIDNKNRITEGVCLQKMGQICYNQGHYAQALDFYLHADKVFNEVDDKNLSAANMAEMGVLYYYNKQLNQARITYNKALTLYRQTKNLKGQADVFGKIGHLYEKQGRYDTAFY